MAWAKPGSLKMEDKLSITGILWRELKKLHMEYCEHLGVDHIESFRKYSIKLIEESLKND